MLRNQENIELKRLIANIRDSSKDISLSVDTMHLTNFKTKIPALKERLEKISNLIDKLTLEMAERHVDL